MNAAVSALEIMLTVIAPLSQTFTLVKPRGGRSNKRAGLTITSGRPEALRSASWISLSARGYFNIHRMKQLTSSLLSLTPIDEHKIILGFFSTSFRALIMFLVPAEHVSSGPQIPLPPRLSKMWSNRFAKSSFTCPASRMSPLTIVNPWRP